MLTEALKTDLRAVNSNITFALGDNAIYFYKLFTGKPSRHFYSRWVIQKSSQVGLQPEKGRATFTSSKQLIPSIVRTSGVPLL